MLQRREISCIFAADMIKVLVESPLFKGISSADIQTFLEQIPYKVKEYGSKDIIAVQGSTFNHLMVVIKGLVQGQMVNDAGKQVVIEELQPSRLLAPAFLYAPQPIVPVNIIALEASEILFIPRNNFTEWMQYDRQLLQNFLMLISCKSSFLTDKIMFLSLKNIKNKIADYLLNKRTDNSQLTIKLTDTQQEIADSFGVTRPSLARAMAEMVDEGIISVDKKVVTILNLQLLQRMGQ